MCPSRGWHSGGAQCSFFKKYLFILVVLGLRCYADFSPVAVGRGYSLATVDGLLIAVASLVAELRLQGSRASVVAVHGLSSCSSQSLTHRFSRCGAHA